MATIAGSPPECDYRRRGGLSFFDWMKFGFPAMIVLLACRYCDSLPRVQAGT